MPPSTPISSGMAWPHAGAACAQRGAKRGIALQQTNRLRQLHPKGQHVAFAKQVVARAIGASDLPLLGKGLLADAPFVFGKRIFLERVRFGQGLGIAFVILRRDQLILAAREKLHEIAQELTRLGKAAITIERQNGEIAAQENPVVDVVQSLQFGIALDQQSVAEGVEGSHEYGAAALAGGACDAMFHLARRSVGERQRQDGFTGQIGIGIQEMADSLGDDAGLARARAGDH